MTSQTVHAEPLLVGDLITRIFSLFFRNFHWFAMISMAPSFVALLVSTVLMAAVGSLEVALVVAGIAYVVLLAGAAGTGAVCADNLRRGAAADVGNSVLVAVKNIVPLTIGLVLVGVAMVIGIVLLVVPGLWLGAVLAAFVPAVVLEGAGLRGLQRSVDLTRGYRWPIVGVLAVLGLCTGVINAVVNVVADVVTAVAGTFPGITVSFVVGSAFTAFVLVFPALVYGRLREIKEPGQTVASTVPAEPPVNG